MERKAFSENPFLKSLLLNWAATLAVFAGLLLLQRTAVLDASIFRAVSRAILAV